MTHYLENSLKRKTKAKNHFLHIIDQTGRDTELQFIYSAYCLIVLQNQPKSASAQRDGKKGKGAQALLH